MSVEKGQMSEINPTKHPDSRIPRIEKWVMEMQDVDY